MQCQPAALRTEDYQHIACYGVRNARIVSLLTDKFSLDRGKKPLKMLLDDVFRCDFPEPQLLHMQSDTNIFHLVAPSTFSSIRCGKILNNREHMRSSGLTMNLTSVAVRWCSLISWSQLRKTVTAREPSGTWTGKILPSLPTHHLQFSGSAS